MMLRNEQIAELLKPIDPARVKKDGKGFSHLEVWDVRRTMNRIFGFAEWSSRVDQMELISEREVSGKDGKTRWNVVYRARCTLDLTSDAFLGTSYTEWAAGDATNPVLAEAHDQAIKTAESQAFKRCAVNLGDQFGLSLYNNGSFEASLDEVNGYEHVDSGRVTEIVEMLESATTEEELLGIASVIRELDLSGDDKRTLRAAYTAANTRIQAATAANQPEPTEDTE
jgi:hypothetical protein